MGVMTCYRKGCDNIMCNRYSANYGYICDDCFKELVRRGPLVKIDDFMATKKEDHAVEEAEARYNVVFPLN